MSFDLLPSFEYNRIEFNKMFAMITYKNLFPRDFSDLQNGQGYVKSLFDHKDEFVSSERGKILDLIDAKKKEIDACKSEQLVDVSELEIIKNNKHAAANSYSYYGKRKEYEDWINDVYPVRKAAIENKLNGRLSLLEKELLDIELRLAKLESRQLKDIINRENSQTVFHTISLMKLATKVSTLRLEVAIILHC